MKKLSILVLAAVGLLITACSTNDALSDAQNPTTLEGKGKGFLNVSVNLPTRPNVNATTRAWAESAQLDDGSANEYAVKSVLIVIFGGASEAAATVQQIESPDAGEANTWNKIGTNKDQVTTRKNYVFQLNDGVTGPFYALAIINGNGIIDKDGSDLKVNGTTKIENCKISDLVGAISEAGTDGKNKFISSDGYFFMTNAVLSEAKGGTEAVNSAKGFILAPVTNIYESESEAEAATAAPSADIYVERGVAKVTMTASLSFDDGISGKGITTLATPALSGWVLDNTNMKSYIVRYTPASGTSWNWGWKSNGNAAIDAYRFVGYNGVDQTSPTVTEAYRTYWCKDPNYEGDAGDYNKVNFYEPKEKTFPATTSDPQYCYENTFDVDHQSYQNTTRAIVKLDLNGGKDFYTMGSDRKTLYDETSVKNAVIARLIMDANFQKWFQSKSSATLDASCISSVTWNRATQAGVIKVKEITIKKDKLTTPPADDVALTSINEEIGGITIKGTDILTAIAGLYGTIKRYVNGATYYSIRIKHFGDDLTPWGWNGEEESTIDKIYPAGTTADARNENYLGRYGMVRNNWYELSLGKILKIGYPIIPWLNPDNTPEDPDNPGDPDPDNPNPEDPEHPDDSLDDSFINARINILSWAKRPQSWNLK